MKKRKEQDRHSGKDKLFVALLYLTGLASLNLLEPSVFSHAFGVILLILGIYGTVSLIKKGNFIFD